MCHIPHLHVRREVLYIDPPERFHNLSLISIVCYLYVSHNPFIRATWRIRIDPLEPFKSHSVIPATWPIHTRDMARSHVWCDAFTCMIWPIHTRDMTHSYMRPDSLMTHSHVWHDSFICVTWLVHMYDMTLLYMRPDSLTWMTWMSCLVHTCDTTHLYMTHTYDLSVCVALTRPQCRPYTSRLYI